MTDLPPLLVLVALLAVVILWVLWVLMPFGVFGANRRLKQVVAEQQETNKLLTQLLNERAVDAGRDATQPMPDTRKPPAAPDEFDDIDLRADR
jgi:biopolymer transport protein ExbB/TolQ